MEPSRRSLAWRLVSIRAALTVIFCATLLGQMGCRQLNADEQRALDEYRRSKLCCGGSGGGA